MDLSLSSRQDNHSNNLEVKIENDNISIPPTKHINDNNNDIIALPMDATLSGDQYIPLEGLAVKNNLTMGDSDGHVNLDDGINEHSNSNSKDTISDSTNTFSTTKDPVLLLKSKENGKLLERIDKNIYSSPNEQSVPKDELYSVSDNNANDSNSTSLSSLNNDDRQMSSNFDIIEVPSRPMNSSDNESTHSASPNNSDELSEQDDVNMIVKQSEHVSLNENEIGDDLSESVGNEDVSNEDEPEVSELTIHRMFAVIMVPSTDSISKVRKFKCSLCENVYRQKSSVLKHIRVHLGLRPFRCSVCEKGFTASSILRRHLQSHSHSEKSSSFVSSKPAVKVKDDSLVLRLATKIKSKEVDKNSDIKNIPSTLSSKGGNHVLIGNVKKKKVTESSGNDKQFDYSELSPDKLFTVYTTTLGTTKVERFKCTVCGNEYRQKVTMLQHLKIHTGIMAPHPYKCSICEEKFATNLMLRSHMLSHKEEQQTSGFAFALSSKSATLNDNNYIPLEMTKDDIKTSSSLLKGEDLTIDEVTATEIKADKHFPAGLIEGLEEVNDSVQFGDVTHNESTIRQMFTTIPSTDATKKFLFKCSLCGSEYRHKNSVLKHLRVHVGIRPYKCSVCEKGFTASGTLRRHMRCHTGEKPFSCSVCFKAFSESGHVQRHMLLHIGEKPWKCSVCGKAFLENAKLNAHMRHHRGERPHKCIYCNKAFGESSTLQKHIRTHTGEKPYECYVCHKGFNELNSLKVHIRTHTGEKPYKCSICGRDFNDSSSIHKHMQIHTGEKPCSCLFCGKLFRETGSLNRHKRIHTGEKPYSCNHCDLTFANSGNLRRHVKRSHLSDGNVNKCDEKKGNAMVSDETLGDEEMLQENRDIEYMDADAENGCESVEIERLNDIRQQQPVFPCVRVVKADKVSS